MNYEETRNILTILRVNYPQSFRDYNKSTGEMFLNLWAEAFAHTPASLVIQAVKAIIYTDTREFAPNIAQVKRKVAEIVNGDMVSAEEAWYRVRSCLRAVIPGDYENQKALWGTLPPMAKKIYDPADLATLAMRSEHDNDIYERVSFIRQYNGLEKKRMESLAVSSDIAALGTSAIKMIDGKKGDNE